MQDARLWFLCTRDSSITITLMRKWDLTGLIANPSKCTRPPNRGIPYPSLCLGHGIYHPTRPTRNQEKVQKSSLRSAANNGQYGQLHQRAADCPQLPSNRVAASMNELTHHGTFRLHKIDVVCCHTRKNTNQLTFGCN